MAPRKKMASLPGVTIPSYTRVAWMFGRRMKAGALLDDPRCAELGGLVAAEAEREGLQPPGLFGAIRLAGLPSDELVLGAVLNGTPIVRETPELRDGVLSREHAVVGARWELGTRVMTSSDEDLSVEADWHQSVEKALDAAQASAVGRELGLSLAPVEVRLSSGVELMDEQPRVRPSGIAWHLVACQAGAAGSLYYGALLPNAGGTYEEGDVHTVTRSAGGNTVRVVGVEIARVDATRPTACLPAEISGVTKERVLRTIERSTGKLRPCGFWLVVD